MALNVRGIWVGLLCMVSAAPAAMACSMPGEPFYVADPVLGAMAERGGILYRVSSGRDVRAIRCRGAVYVPTKEAALYLNKARCASYNENTPVETDWPHMPTCRLYKEATGKDAWRKE